ncbi:MAG: hypothetical protein OIF50_05675 [Flavobacteriaceae bacterium]|nr:hypothetical protein [Flavobacteriaceae bacterium]
MRALFLCILALFVFSCKKNKAIEINHLNGRWEIVEVFKNEDKLKSYSPNNHLDYFQTDKGQGYRMKVQLQLDGTYKSSGDQKTFLIENKESKTFLTYNNALSVWKEEIIELTASKLVVRNEENLIYHYKKRP